MSINSITNETKYSFLKTIYEQGAKHHLHFLTWRERLIASYIAIIAALLISVSWLYKNPSLHGYLFLVFLILLFLSYGFRELERRNSYLFIDVQNVLLTIEKEMNLSQEENTNRNTSLFFTMDNSHNYWQIKRGNKYIKKNIPHSNVLNFTYNSVMILSSAATIACLLWYNLQWSQPIMEKYWVKLCFKIFLSILGIAILLFTFVVVRQKKITKEDRIKYWQRQ